MMFFKKAHFLPFLLLITVFAQVVCAQNPSIDDILGSSYVEKEPQPSDTAHILPGPIPIKLDSQATINIDSITTTEIPKDTSNTIDLASQTNVDSTITDTTITDSSNSSGGLVLYEATSNSEKEKELNERYHRGELIYKYQASVGWQSPSRGMVSLEYIVSKDLLNVGIHFTDVNSKLFQIGAALQYYPMEMRYFYMFLSSDWVHGEYERERDIGRRVFEEYDETVNYWRVVVGIGGEALFLEHFGAYIEVGFEFFAGEGGYYLHLNKEHGHLSNNSFKLPYGIGLLFPF